jgi:hypothetical protein
MLAGTKFMKKPRSIVGTAGHFRKSVFLSVFILCLTAAAFGQAAEAIETELLGQLKEINTYSAYGENNDGDKLDAANEAFRNKLLKYAAENPSTLEHKFPKLSEMMYIATSADGRLRIYSWDTEAGGTMHFFDNVFQYQGADGKVYAKGNDLEDEDAGGFYSDIYTLATKRGTVYIGRFNSILSTSYAFQSAHAFRIEKNSLNDKYKIFKTGSGMQNSIGFAYDFFSVVDRPERPVRLFVYDEAKKELKIPVVIEDEEIPQGRITDRFIIYRFTGKYFEKVKGS